MVVYTAVNTLGRPAPGPPSLHLWSAISTWVRHEKPSHVRQAPGGAAHVGDQHFVQLGLGDGPSTARKQFQWHQHLTSCMHVRLNG
jgi:hypothetical protein